MARIIMLTLIGILCLFLLLSVLAVIGLDRTYKALKQSESIQHINQDIQKINTELKLKDTTLLLCRGLNLVDLKERQINEKSNHSEIQLARWQIVQTSRKMAQCYKEKTWDCILKDMGLCTQISLHAFGESLNISGRHLEMEFTDQEKMMYRKVAALHQSDPDKETVMRLADRAYPVFENALDRLNSQFISAQNKYK